MTGTFAWILVGLGLAVVTVRRRVLGVGAVTAQAAVLVGLAVHHARGPDDLVAAAALAVRSLALAAFLLLLIARTRDTRPVPSGAGVLGRGAAGVALALALVWLIPATGLGQPATGRAVLAMVALGLAAAATSRATLSQILGIVVIENGLVLAALGLAGTSWLIELGLAVDLTILALVAGVFHRRIFAEFGVGDTGVLGSLRD